MARPTPALGVERRQSTLRLRDVPAPLEADSYWFAGRKRLSLVERDHGLAELDREEGLNGLNRRRHGPLAEIKDGQLGRGRALQDLRFQEDILSLM